MRQELHSHSGGVVLVWHKKSNMLFSQFSNQPPPHFCNSTVSFFNNNNNNNNNNNGCHNNRYVVPVPAVAPAPSQPAEAGNSRQLACEATNEAARHEQDQRMAACIAHAASQPGLHPLCHLRQCCPWQQILLWSQQWLQIEWVVSPLY